ncbi:serine hydrolase domain-containing protein [Sphingomonas sp. MMS24-J13]|uniref:serine hydrolase domain-containing protein n=1 Tax=Sphingomonas sp. MMS24-J13 TaxID=3238686 RepID=UPI00384A53EB
MSGFSQERLDHLKTVIEQDVAKGAYFGAVLKVARGGAVGFDEAIGAGDSEGTKPLAKDSVFSIFSTSKAFTNILILRAIEMGRFALTTRIADIIPEFTGSPRDRVTFFHLLTHTTGMPGVWMPKPGMYLDNLQELLEAVVENVHGLVEPGQRCDYSPLANHVLMGEALRRTDPKGRRFRDILREDLFEPLGMTSTSMGLRPDLRDRHVKPDMRGTVPIKHLSRTLPGDHALFEDPDVEAPHVGCASSVPDLSRFAEMLRRGGELDGVRILSPRTIAVARKVWTADMPNELYRGVAVRSGWEPGPAYMGLGFNVRGTKIFNHQLGTLTSPETFGNYGAGSALFWVDPELDVSFACLTAGVMTQAANIERFQKLSDIVVSACV